MKILILGAAGQIGKMLTDDLLNQTSTEIILYARDASKRLKSAADDRVNIIDGNFLEADKLVKAMQSVDIVYLNDMGTPSATQSIIDAMKRAHVKRIIGATILGIYGEVSGPFGQWNERMVGGDGTKRQAQSANIIEQSSLDYTLLRLTWLYNQPNNRKYTLTQKGEPFIGAQVTRQAVTKLIMDIINCQDNHHFYKSLGVSEPNTDWAKPSFY